MSGKMKANPGSGRIWNLLATYGPKWRLPKVGGPVRSNTSNMPGRPCTGLAEVRYDVDANMSVVHCYNDYRQHPVEILRGSAPSKKLGSLAPVSRGSAATDIIQRSSCVVERTSIIYLDSRLLLLSLIFVRETGQVERRVTDWRRRLSTYFISSARC